MNIKPPKFSPVAINKENEWGGNQHAGITPHYDAKGELWCP